MRAQTCFLTCSLILIMAPAKAFMSILIPGISVYEIDRLRAFVWTLITVIVLLAIFAGFYKTSGYYKTAPGR